LATYINHQVRAKRATDLEVFDALMKDASAKGREVLGQFRDYHAFDPWKILATELHIAVDENCDNYIELGPRGIGGTSSTDRLCGIERLPTDAPSRRGPEPRAARR